MGLVRKKGCLYGCVATVAIGFLVIFSLLGFEMYRMRKSCIENTVPLDQAKARCNATLSRSTVGDQSEIAQRVLARLESLSPPSSTAVTLSAKEVQALLNYVISHPLPQATNRTDSTGMSAALFMDSRLRNTLLTVSISKDALSLCAVTPVDTSLFSFCPAGGKRGNVQEAILVPSTDVTGQPLKIVEAHLNNSKVASPLLTSFQTGLNAVLLNANGEKDSTLLLRYTKGIEKITLDEGSLTLHPTRSPNSSESPR